MIISEIVDKDVFICKNNYFSLDEEGKKKENSTALEGEKTGPIHPKVELLSERDQCLNCLEF